MLINNTSSNLTIESDGVMYDAPTKKVTRIRWPGNTLSLHIKSGLGNSWDYKVKFFSNSYAKNGKSYMQIEPDGAVYLLPIGTLTPMGKLPPQPTGYPLKPGN